MSARPLPGPDGLYTVSELSLVLADSGSVGWSGAFFADIRAVPEGRVDHAHARLYLRRKMQHEWRQPVSLSTGLP